jgi:hypothetical protein
MSSKQKAIFAKVKGPYHLVSKMLSDYDSFLMKTVVTTHAGVTIPNEVKTLIQELFVNTSKMRSYFIIKTSDDEMVELMMEFYEKFIRAEKMMMKEIESSVINSSVPTVDMDVAPDGTVDIQEVVSRCENQIN